MLLSSSSWLFAVLFVVDVAFAAAVVVDAAAAAAAAVVVAEDDCDVDNDAWPHQLPIIMPNPFHSFLSVHYNSWR